MTDTEVTWLNNRWTAPTKHVMLCIGRPVREHYPLIFFISGRRQMAEPFGANALNNGQEITAAQVNHLPIVASYARRLGLVEIVNRLVPVEMDVEPGIIVLGMVLDTLSGRSPLYHLESAFEACDRGVLFGQEIPASYFSDDNAGRVLDHLFNAGTQKIFSALSVSALRRFELSTRHVHFDTTSVNVYGQYLGASGEEAPFKINFGHSKDKRPDLKQFVLSLLCVDGDVPIVGKLEDGNASDKKINNQVLGDVARHMRAHGVDDKAFIYIADSAMVTQENLDRAGPFITRLPATYNECERALLSAIDADQWEEIGAIAVTRPSKNRPVATYRVHEETVTLYGQRYRAVVVHSSAHDRRRQKRLERELAASLKAITVMEKAHVKKQFFCQADAEAAALDAMAQDTAYHQLKLSVVERPRYARGRPRKGTPRTPVAMEYGLRAEVIEKQHEIARRRKMAGCFVLLSNVAGEGEQGYSTAEILRSYKEQHAIETNFGFLKDDQIVNALFLNRVERIEALGLILLISLLIWRLIEHAMRADLEAHDTTVPGWDNKPTRRPTAYMLTWKFKGVMTLCIGECRRLSQPLSPVQVAFLTALQVPESCFTHVPRAG
jgi:transposase